MSFAPIRISILRGDQKISFDVYIEIASKYILYLRKGESFEGSRLNRLRQKKLKKMYIREEEEQSYRDYMERNMAMAYDARSGSLENRTQIIQGLQQAGAEAVFENPTDQETYRSVKEGAQRFTDFLMAEDRAIKSLMAIENLDSSLSHHGVTVASLAVEIAKVTGYNDVKGIPYIALGGLLHDVGHYLSGQNVSRSLNAFSEEEMAIYRTHPGQGASKIKDLKHMDLQVSQIIMHHEERVNASGFPSGLNEKQVNPLALFVQSANLFDRMVTFERIPRDEVLRRLISAEFLGCYPLLHLQAIKAIVSRI